MDHVDSSKDDLTTAAAERGETTFHPAENPFVGRDPEVGQGLSLLEDVLAGRGKLLLLGGDPGIGKSRMAGELSARAKARGMQVVWGRCWEAGGAPAYWPWVQSLRSVIRDLDADHLRAQMGAGAVDIAQLVPEVRVRLGDLATPTELEPDSARFRLFDSATTLLKNAAGPRPLMLVLDDLHVADTPSLLLLRFVASALGDERIFILGTYRDTELHPNHPLAAALTELARHQAVCRVTLRGLTASDVMRVIAVTAGVTPHESLVRAIHDETDGNPLFLGEVIRLLLEQGRLTGEVIDSGLRIGMPRSVREVIGQRLEHLADECLDLLRLASVLGREFSLDALCKLSGRPFDDTLRALDEPLAARVITDVPGTRSLRRFAHAVIRECLYDDIGSGRRMQLHRRAAQVLEAMYGDDAEPHLAELAHHYFEGIPGGDVEKAIRYAWRAGDRAVSMLAFEEAVRLYRTALQALQCRESREPKEECDVLLALGDAQTRAADEAGAKETFLQVAGLSRRHNLRQHLARAALGYGGRFVWGRAGGDLRMVPLLEEGREAVGDEDSPLKARILARLAGALRDDRSLEPRESLGEQAVDLARRLGDPATLAYALEGLHAALWRPDNPQQRLEIAGEAIAVGSKVRDLERVLHAHEHRLFAFLEFGDMAVGVPRARCDRPPRRGAPTARAELAAGQHARCARSLRRKVRRGRNLHIRGLPPSRADHSLRCSPRPGSPAVPVAQGTRAVGGDHRAGPGSREGADLVSGAALWARRPQL